MTKREDVNRAKVLGAVVSGARRVPDVVTDTHLSEATVRTRLKELERDGQLHVEWKVGPGGSRIELLTDPGRPEPLDHRGGSERAEAGLAAPLPVAALWFRLGLSSQAEVVDELLESGADAVLDCTGEFDLMALYSANSSHVALQTARVMSRRPEVDVRYGMIIGVARPIEP
jgi:hypothetical protein